MDTAWFVILDAKPIIQREDLGGEVRLSSFGPELAACARQIQRVPDVSIGQELVHDVEASEIHGEIVDVVSELRGQSEERRFGLVALGAVIRVSGSAEHVRDEKTYMASVSAIGARTGGPLTSLGAMFGTDVE